jgi:hypothetical protein
MTATRAPLQTAVELSREHRRFEVSTEPMPKVTRGDGRCCEEPRIPTTRTPAERISVRILLEQTTRALGEAGAGGLFPTAAGHYETRARRDGRGCVTTLGAHSVGHKCV